MKKLIFIALLALLFTSLPQSVEAQTCPPPALPSSFYGMVLGAKSGQEVSVYANGLLAAKTRTFLYGNTVVYRIDVPGLDPCNPTRGGGTENASLKFQIGGQTIGSAVWHGGSNVKLNLIYKNLISRTSW
jgi:hypothetical protein